MSVLLHRYLFIDGGLKYGRQRFAPPPRRKKLPYPVFFAKILEDGADGPHRLKNQYEPFQ